MSERPANGEIADRVLRELHRRYVRKGGATAANIELALEDLRALKAGRPAEPVVQDLPIMAEALEATARLWLAGGIMALVLIGLPVALLAPPRAARP